MTPQLGFTSPGFAVIGLIVGPAGSGKTTIADKLLEFYRIKKVITTTTRTPREDEINGVHYHFVSPERFQELIEAGAFIEWSIVHGKEGEKDRYYGIQKADIMQALDDNGCFSLSVDIQGFVKLRQIQDPRLQASFISFFIDAGDETLLGRMEQRDRKSMGDKYPADDALLQSERRRRIASAANERSIASQYPLYRIENENGGLAAATESVYRKIVNFRQHRLIETECDR